MGEHLGDPATVLSLQAGEQRHPLFDLFEPAGRRLERGDVGAKRNARVLDLVPERRDPLGQPGELGVDLGGGGQLRRRGSEQLGRATVPVLGRDRLGAAERRAPQRLEVPQPLPLDRQLGRLILARRDALDLVELEREQVELALAAGGELAQIRLARLDHEHPSVSVADAGPEVRHGFAAETVEDVELHRREHQLAVLVLAVEREQRAPELAEIGHGRRPPTHIGAGPAVGPHAPGEHDLLRSGRQELEIGQFGGIENTPST